LRKVWKPANFLQNSPIEDMFGYLSSFFMLEVGRRQLIKSINYCIEKMGLNFVQKFMSNLKSLLINSGYKGILQVIN